MDSLVGFQQAVVLDVLQLLNGGLDVLLAEQVIPALVVNTVDLAQLFTQHLLK